MAESVTNRKSGQVRKRKKSNRASRTPHSNKSEALFFEEDLSEFSDPQNTVQQIFDHDKKALLRTIRTLLRFASKLKLGDSEYNPDGDYLLDEHLEAREIADRLKRIEYLKSIVNH